MELDVIRANQGLTERINVLSGQVARLENQLQLCLEVISQFGHFVPTVIEDFKDEMKKMDADDAIKITGENDDQSSETGDVNL